MKITDQFKNNYEKYLISYLPKLISENINFKNSISENLDELIELSTEPVCLARKNGMKLNCEPSIFAERIIQVADGQEIIAGARFKNLDVNFPFIEIQKSFPIDSTALFNSIKNKIINEFSDLKPKVIKFKDAPGLHPELQKWSHTVFGEIDPSLQKTDFPGLNFDFNSALDWHPRYVEEYLHRLNEKNELMGFVRIGELDEFQEALDNQSLMIINDDQGFSGVIAGINSPFYGLPAIYMIESYLSKRWVGKKIAPFAHTNFFNQISPRFNYVWGTIYDQNLSSLNTALRTGRKIIETEYFFEFV